MKVLIVDDNEDITYSIRKALEALNPEYEITEAWSGKECLDKAGNADIILLDIMMPEMDGFQVSEQITTKPILFITGKAHMMREAKARNIEFLMKPVNIKVLDRKIREMLS